jgi:allantoate deiminase
VAIVEERIKKNLEDLALFTSTPGNGTTRLPFTPEARGADKNHRKE